MAISDPSGHVQFMNASTRTGLDTYGAPNAAKFEGRRLDIERTKSMSISISTVFFPYEIDVDIDIDSALSMRNRCRYR